MTGQADLFAGASYERTATFAAPGIRLTLTRRWARGPIACVIGHNPSDADADKDDPTSRWWNRWFAAAGMRADAGWDAQREAAARAAASRKGATTAFSAHAPKATVFELPVPSVAPTSRKGATMPITIPPVVAPRTVPVLPTVPPRGREEK